MISVESDDWRLAQTEENVFLIEQGRRQAQPSAFPVGRCLRHYLDTVQILEQTQPASAYAMRRVRCEVPAVALGFAFLDEDGLCEVARRFHSAINGRFNRRRRIPKRRPAARGLYPEPRRRCRSLRDLGTREWQQAG
jgi:hypothetical protein